MLMIIIITIIIIMQILIMIIIPTHMTNNKHKQNVPCPYLGRPSSPAPGGGQSVSALSSVIIILCYVYLSLSIYDIIVHANNNTPEVARVCQLYPHYAAAALVKRFFRVYDKWNWRNPGVYNHYYYYY